MYVVSKRRGKYRWHTRQYFSLAAWGIKYGEPVEFQIRLLGEAGNNGVYEVTHRPHRTRTRRHAKRQADIQRRRGSRSLRTGRSGTTTLAMGTAISRPSTSASWSSMKFPSHCTDSSANDHESVPRSESSVRAEDQQRDWETDLSFWSFCRFVCFRRRFWSVFVFSSSFSAKGGLLLAGTAIRVRRPDVWRCEDELRMGMTLCTRNSANVAIQIVSLGQKTLSEIERSVSKHPWTN